MNIQARDGFSALTEKEKQTLRLIVRGHDAKSTARSLGLSVHTINERLRDARRKMAVSSSREAARLLLAIEGLEGRTYPEFSGDDEIGEDAVSGAADRESAPNGGAGRTRRLSRLILGATLMTLLFSLLALAALPQASAPPAATAAVTNPEAVDAARQWLALVDAGRWEESYRATGAAFRKLNTVQSWTSVSQRVRTPLGAMIERRVAGDERVAAPPFGYQVVKFRTRYAHRADALETVTLEREDGGWRVVGVTIE